MLALAAAVLVGSVPVRAGEVQGTFIQLSTAQASWSEGEWSELFDHFESLDLRQLVIQWAVFDETAFYSSGAFASAAAPSLERVMDLAEGSGLAVLVGLAYDPGFELAIRRDPKLVDVYLRRLRLRSLTAAEEIQAQLGGRSCFAGWYLPEEIDDVHWLEPERRQLLAEHLRELTTRLRELSPKATLAISGFSNSYADPETLEDFWRQLLTAADLDRVLFQDGVGVGKQRLEDLPLYLGALQRATASTSRQLQVVTEVFQQVEGPPFDDLPFRAVPAPVERVRQQLEVAARHADSGVLIFAVPEYMTPARGQAADRLYRSFVHQQGEPAAAVTTEAAVNERLDLSQPERSGADPAARASLEANQTSAGAEAGGTETGAVGGNFDSAGLPAGSKIFELQLGLFHHQDNARSFVGEYERRGYRPYLQEVFSSKGETRYTVRVGPYRSMDEAEAAAAEMLRQEGLATVIRFRTLR